MNPRHPGHEHDTKPPGEPITPPPATSEDVNLGVIVRFALGLLAVMGLVSAFIVFFMNELEKREKANDRAHDPGPLAQHEPRRQAEGVRLQEQPFKDVEALRNEERQLLEKAGWVDEGTGIGRIPIDDAMRLVVQRGLPTRSMLAEGEGAAPGLSFAAATPTPSPSPSPRPRPRPVSRPSTPSPETAPAPTAPSDGVGQ